MAKQKVVFSLSKRGEGPVEACCGIDQVQLSDIMLQKFFSLFFLWSASCRGCDGLLYLLSGGSNSSKLMGISKGKNRLLPVLLYTFCSGVGLSASIAAIHT